MKISQSRILLIVLALYLAFITESSVSAYPRFRILTKRILAAVGDLTLPANNFTLDNGVYEVWYEFTSGNVTNSTDLNNSTNATNSTGLGDMNMTGMNMTGMDMSGMNMSGMDMSGMDMSGMDMSGMDMSGMDMSGMNMTGVSMHGTGEHDLDKHGMNGTNSTEEAEDDDDDAVATENLNLTTNATHVTFAIKFNLPGQYFAIGFGSTEMEEADIWTFEIVNDTVVASDRYAFEMAAPPLDSVSGGTSDLELLGYDIATNYTLVKVRRAVNTNDTLDHIIAPGTNNLLWAYANATTMEYHGMNHGLLDVNLTYI